MTRTEKTLKSQLNAARAEIEDLYLALEEMKEREKIYLARLSDRHGNPPRKMTLADFDSPIDLDKVAEAI
jgi:hypothetical protein